MIPKCFHHNKLKMKGLLSPLNIHLLKITPRENSEPSFLHLNKSFKKQEKECIDIKGKQQM